LQDKEKLINEKWKQSVRQMEGTQNKIVDQQKDEITKNQREMAMKIL